MARNMASSWRSWMHGSGTMIGRSKRCATITFRGLSTPSQSCLKYGGRHRNWRYPVMLITTQERILKCFGTFLSNICCFCISESGDGNQQAPPGGRQRGKSSKTQWNFHGLELLTDCSFLRPPYPHIVLQMRKKTMNKACICRTATLQIGKNTLPSGLVSWEFSGSSFTFTFSSPALWRSWNNVGCNRETLLLR